MAGLLASAGVASAMPVSTIAGPNLVKKAQVVVQKTTVVRRRPAVVVRPPMVVQKRRVIVR